MRGNSLSADNPFWRAMLSVSPGSFALVMATGIVSAAMREVGLATVGDVMLGIAAAAFLAIACASCGRAALAPTAVAADLTTASRGFAAFAFVAACAVLGSGLSGTGHRVAASVLAWTGLAAWLALTCAVAARFALGRTARPRLDDVNGTWYLCAVATQALSISASFLREDQELPAGAAQPVAIVLWAVGFVAYLGISVLVALRLHAAGLGPVGLRAPYWVAMGAASISVLAAAQILRGPDMSPGGAGHAVVAAVAVTLWLLATGLIPILVAVTAALSLRWPPRLRYWTGAWTIVFPLGMYAVASMQLGVAADLPLARGIGTAEAWGAFAAWALTFALLIFAARPPWRRPGVEPSAIASRPPQSVTARTPPPCVPVRISAFNFSRAGSSGTRAGGGLLGTSVAGRRPYLRVEVAELPDADSFTENDARVPVVAAPVVIDIDNVGELRAWLLRASAGGQSTVVLDMRATDFCDSAGLSVLIRARRRALAEGGDLRLVISTTQVARILAVTGLDRWFPCFTSLAEAMDVPSAPPDHA